MKVNRKIHPKSVRFTDNNNIDCSPYFVIEYGIFRFIDKQTKIDFMYNYGITCGCERVIEKSTKKIKYCYNGIEITEAQRNFLKIRAKALSSGKLLGVKNDCNCKKKARPE